MCYKRFFCFSFGEEEMNVHIYGNLFRLVISSTIASTLFGEKKENESRISCYCNWPYLMIRYVPRQARRG